MTDWADEIAASMLRQLPNHNEWDVYAKVCHPEDVAAALRRARVNALEEAFNVAWNAGTMGSGNIAVAIRALKDKP